MMTLLVRDDQDVLDANLRYHLAQGVDLVIATDHGSVDGSRDVLEEHRRQGHLVLLEEHEADFHSARWRTRMARMAASEFDADWVITPDPDEFLWPASGTLREVFSAIEPPFSLLSMPRTEFLPSTNDAGFFADRMIVRESTASGGAKVAHRGVENIQVSTGSHWAAAGDSPIRPRRTYSNLTEVPYWPVRIFHFRFRSYAQFERGVRIRLGTTFEGRHEAALLGLAKSVGVTQEEIISAYREGNLAEVYQEKIVAKPKKIASGIQDGTFVVDRRFQQLFSDDATSTGSLARPSREHRRRDTDSPSLPYLGWPTDEAAQIQRAMAADLAARFRRLELRRTNLETRPAAIDRSLWRQARHRLAATLGPKCRRSRHLRSLTRVLTRHR